MDLIKYSYQVVSGVNYILVFQSSKGKISVTCYSQAWNNFFKILSVKKYAL
jgi:hypothetical protein